MSEVVHSEKNYMYFSIIMTLSVQVYILASVYTFYSPF